MKRRGTHLHPSCSVESSVKIQLLRLSVPSPKSLHTTLLKVHPVFDSDTPEDRKDQDVQEVLSVLLESATSLSEECTDKDSLVFMAKNAASPEVAWMRYRAINPGRVFESF